MIIGQLLFTLLWQSECVSQRTNTTAGLIHVGVVSMMEEEGLFTNDTVFYYFGNLVQSLYSVGYWLLKTISLSPGIWLMILGILLLTRNVFWTWCITEHEKLILDFHSSETPQGTAGLDWMTKPTDQ